MSTVQDDSEHLSCRQTNDFGLLADKRALCPCQIIGWAKKSGTCEVHWFAETNAAHIARVVDGSKRGVALSCQCIDCLDRHRKTGRKPSIHYRALECSNGGPQHLSAWRNKPADVSVRLLMVSFLACVEFNREFHLRLSRYWPEVALDMESCRPHLLASSAV